MWLQKLAYRILKECPHCHASYLCSKCNKPAHPIGSKKMDNSDVMCVPCLLKSIKDRTEFVPRHASKLKRKLIGKELYTDNGKIIRTDGFGNYIYKGANGNTAKLNERQLKQTLNRTMDKIDDQSTYGRKFRELSHAQEKTLK